MDELTSAVVETALDANKPDWGLPPRLYALTRRSALNSLDPKDLPDAVRDAAQGALIPIEQDPLPEGQPGEVLARIHWPEEVAGCVLVTELVVLPPAVKHEKPDEASAAEQWASRHPDGRKARLTVGVLRDGRYACCLQLRGDEKLLDGDALADDVVTALLSARSDVGVDQDVMAGRSVAKHISPEDDRDMSRFGGSEFGGGHPELGGQYPYGSPRERSPYPDGTANSFFNWHPERLSVPTDIEELEKTKDLSALSEGPEKVPELPPARPVKLTIGHPGSDRVVVEEIRLDSIPRDIVISCSRGVQIGKHNRQLNDYRYELDKPTASLDDVFEGHPIRQWAFEKLVDNPDAIMANYFFRTLLPEGPLYSGERIGFAETGPREVRITARLGEQSAILVDKSWGVQVANWSTQRNRFHYTVEQPEFHLETALRDPDVARGLAMAVKYPDRPAVQRSLIHRLEGTYDGSGWSIGDVYTQFGKDIPRPVTGDGVQFGYADTRKDKVRIRADQVILTGWERMAELKADGQERDQRLEESQQNRISASRPPGFVAAGTTRAPEGFLPYFIERAAAATLDQVAPGRPHLAAGMAAEIKRALDNPEESGHRDDATGVKVSLAPGNDAFGFRRETVPSGLGVQYSGTEPARGFRRKNEGEQASDQPRLELVEFAGQERRPDGVTPEVTEVVWPQDVPRSGSGSASPARVMATGAVISGSARAIAAAAGPRFPDADLLLAYARRRVWDDRYDGGYRSVAPAMRAVQALQVVLFVDPSLGTGLWVDVDQARQAPAAVLPIEIDLAAGPPGRCRIFRS